MSIKTIGSIDDFNNLLKSTHEDKDIDKKINEFIRRLFKKEDKKEEIIVNYTTSPSTPLQRLFRDDENILKDVIENYNENDSIEEQFLTVSILEELNMF